MLLISLSPSRSLLETDPDIKRQQAWIGIWGLSLMAPIQFNCTLRQSPPSFPQRATQVELNSDLAWVTSTVGVFRHGVVFGARLESNLIPNMFVAPSQMRSFNRAPDALKMLLV